MKQINVKIPVEKSNGDFITLILIIIYLYVYANIGNSSSLEAQIDGNSSIPIGQALYPFSIVTDGIFSFSTK